MTWTSTWTTMRGVAAGQFGYDVAVLDQDGRLLHLPVGQLVWEEQPDELSGSVTCRLPDVDTTEGPMASLVLPGTPLFLSLTERGAPGGPRIQSSASSRGNAWDPERETEGGTPGGFAGAPVAELLRGQVLKVDRASDGIELQVTVRDSLATLLKSDVDVHFDAGTTAAEALSDLFGQWGVQLGEIAWPDVQLPTFTARGEKAAKVIDDLLAEGPKQGAGVYTLRMRGEVLDVVMPGTNPQVLWLRAGDTITQSAGAGVSRYSVDITDLVQSVKVVGTGGGWDEGVTSELSAETDFNGAQRVVVERTDITEEMAALQARAELAKSAFPGLSISHDTVDVPLLRKWDRVRITDSLLDGYFIVVGVSHDATHGSMHLQLETPEDFERKAHLRSLQAQLDRLRGEQEAVTRLAGRGGSGVEIIQRIVQPVLGRPYVYGGPLGRSVFDANPAPGTSTDCSGFVAWLYAQLGHPNLPAQTMSIYAQIGKTLQQLGTSTANAAPGDILLWNVVDPGNPAQPYGHVSVYLQGNQHVESGGNAGGIGISAMLSVPYLVLRSNVVFAALNGGGRALA